jgi:hypothetical protein
VDAFILSRIFSSSQKEVRSEIISRIRLFAADGVS